LFRVLAAAADEALSPLGITASDRALIEFLVREPEPVSLAELARKRSVSRQHIHQSLARLPNTKWIEKIPDPHDARSVRLRLTDEGRALWKSIRSIDRNLLRRAGRKVDIARVPLATEILQQVRHAIEGHDQD